MWVAHELASFDETWLSCRQDMKQFDATVLLQTMSRRRYTSRGAENQTHVLSRSFVVDVMFFEAAIATSLPNSA